MLISLPTHIQMGGPFDLFGVLGVPYELGFGVRLEDGLLATLSRVGELKGQEGARRCKVFLSA